VNQGADGRATAGFRLTQRLIAAISRADRGDVFGVLRRLDQGFKIGPADRCGGRRLGRQLDRVHLWTLLISDPSDIVRPANPLDDNVVAVDSKDDPPVASA
jgi:hypothetical protein